jgi:NAD+ kinase
MKRIGFAFNPTMDAAVALRERALAWCSERGIDAWAAPASEYDTLVEELGRSDALIVLGGDGTFLRAARAVAVADVPILGVNAGKVGFLSKAESDALETVLDQLSREEYTLEPRMVLEARLLPSGQEQDGALHVALNEAAIVRGSQARVVRLELLVDESHVATYIADGLVVASPTGSTGYSFSAGGPILDPTARNLVVTPVAAYLSAIRSIVVGGRHTVTVRVVDAVDCQVSIDGREDVPLAIGDVVRVRARERPIHFIEPVGAMPFWELLRHKAELLPS